ncbi:hypothetical protein [Legionella hackeliae]|uniref:Uncharacterized protein n=1 Tax=Legionella hackeliae TaxID=449 RepID=A0A0A8UKK4_LEGHA|nr:hypothetical protein [Legionella hackeliae]KTD12938.1 hypothetical protein Lhac_1809 [Legionella hackeliae]CEK09248.1 protein of unknown function [Legionella hackeliae]STX49155.1 Uncharacterised protein [Legionella hackeliae]
MKKSSSSSSKKQAKEKVKKDDLKNISGGSDQRNRNLQDPRYTISPPSSPSPRKPRHIKDIY